VADIMTREVVTVTEDTPVQEILHLMVTEGIHRVPVVKEGKVVGIVSAMNVLEALLEGKLIL
jgi:CBS domain-containing protein